MGSKFNQLVEARIAKTGEPWAEAARQVRAQGAKRGGGAVAANASRPMFEPPDHEGTEMCFWSVSSPITFSFFDALRDLGDVRSWWHDRSQAAWEVVCLYWVEQDLYPKMRPWPEPTEWPEPSSDPVLAALFDTLAASGNWMKMPNLKEVKERTSRGLVSKEDLPEYGRILGEIGHRCLVVMQAWDAKKPGSEEAKATLETMMTALGKLGIRPTSKVDSVAGLERYVLDAFNNEDPRTRYHQREWLRRVALDASAGRVPAVVQSLRNIKQLASVSAASAESP